MSMFSNSKNADKALEQQSSTASTSRKSSPSKSKSKPGPDALVSPYALMAMGLAGASSVSANVPNETERLAAAVATAAEPEAVPENVAASDDAAAQPDTEIAAERIDGPAPTALEQLASEPSAEVQANDAAAPAGTGFVQLAMAFEDPAAGGIVSDSPQPMLLADASTATTAGETATSAGGTAASGATAGAEAAGAAAGGVSIGGILAAVAGLALAGGGGGSSGGGGVAAAAGTAITGVVADGLISGAKVYVDMNDNGKVDAGDIQIATSDANGRYSATLTDAMKSHSLIAVGGTDTSTGLGFKSAFTATAPTGSGDAMITPLTTLVQAIVKDGATLADAKQQVAEALGLPPAVDLASFNAVAGTVGADSSQANGITQGQAIEIQAKALMVANLMAAGTAALSGAASAAGTTVTSATAADLSSNVVTGLVVAIRSAANSDETVNLSDSATLKQVVSEAITSAKDSFALDDTYLAEGAANSAEQAVADSVAAANAIINTVAGSAISSAGTQASATDSSIVEALTQMLQAQKAVQGTVADALDDGTTTALNNVADNFDSITEVFTQANTFTTGLTLTNTVAADTTIAADTTAPTVGSVTGSATTTPFNAGDLIEFKINMSEGVIVSGGIPQLNITVGGAARIALFDAGRSSGDAMVFVYKVQGGEDGAVAVTSTSLALNGATVKDLAGNNANLTPNNIASGWTIDNTAPGVAISSASNFLSAGAATTITFTLSEAAASNSFTAADITASGGTLGALSQSPTNANIYTASLTPASGSNVPATVKVGGGTFTDAAGNSNTASNVLAVAVDTVAPQVLVKSDLGVLKAGQTAALTFDLSKPATDFTAGDVTVSGGTLSNFAGSGTAYSATFTPTADGTATVAVAAGTFTSSGNNNTVSNTLSMAVDAAVPTVAITSNKTGTLKAGETATITFDLSELSTNFTRDDVTVSGGAMGPLTQNATDKTVYTGVFTPAVDSTASGSITVAAGKFTDAAGNANIQGSVNLTVDTQRPLVQAVSDNVAGVANAATGTITYAYTFSEAVTGLAASDFTVTSGQVSSVTPVNATNDFATAWNVTVIPTQNVASGNVVVTLKQGGVSDAAGNGNIGSTNAAQVVDTLTPSAPVLALGTGVGGGATAAEATASGGVVTVSGESGASIAVTLTNAGNGAQTLTRTLTGTGAAQAVVLTADDLATLGGNGTINVSAVATDAALNAGSAGTTSFVLDQQAPTIGSFATNKPDGSYKAGETIQITATASEAVAAGSAFVATLSGGGNVTLTAASAGTSLSGTYTVLAGENTGDLTVASFGAGTVQDVAGNAMTATALPAGNNNIGAVKAIVIDTTAPTVTARSPGDDGNSPGLAANLTLSFSEAVSVGSGNIVLRSGNSVVETFAVTGDKVTVNGTQVSINPTANLTHDQPYHVTIEPGALRDAAGNPFAGIANATDWNFTGKDVSVSVATVSGDGKINASEAQAPVNVSGTVSAGVLTGSMQVALQPTSGNAVPLQNINYNQTTGTWTADIPTGLTDGSYTLSASFTGSGAGNGISATGTASVQIDTAAPSAPTLALTTDSGSSGSDSITNSGALTVTGTEQGATVEYSLSGATGWTSSFTPQTGSNTVYVRQLDGAGNPSVASNALNFMLDASAPAAPTPTLAADSGTSGSDGITNSGLVNVTGLETGIAWAYSVNGGDFVAGSGTSFTLTGDGAKSVVVRQTDTAGNTTSSAPLAFTLDTTVAKPTATLAADTGNNTNDGITNNPLVNVGNIEAGAAWQYSTDNGSTWADGSGSSFAISGQNNKQILVRQTDAAGNASVNSDVLAARLDSAAPTATGYLPADNGLSPGLSNFLTLSFSEPVFSATGNIVLHRATDDSVVESFSVSTNKVTVAGNNIAFDPTADLVNDQTYYVKVDAGAFTDNAGNPFAGIANTTTWNFTGKDVSVSVGTVAGDGRINGSEAQGVVPVSGTVSAGVLTGSVQVVLQPASGNAVPLQNISYNQTTGAWTADIPTGVADGSYTLSASFTGSGAGAGISANGTAAVLIDTAVPSAPTLALATDSGTSSNDALTNVGTVDVSGIESGASWQYSVNGGDFVNGTGASFTVPGGGGEAKSVVVKQTDLAGNAGSNSTALAFTLDTTAPGTTLSGAALSADTAPLGAFNNDFNTKTAAQTITATLSAPLAAGEKLYGSLDNGTTWSDVSSSVSGTTLTLTGQTLTGSNTMKLKVTDAAGNDGTVASQAYVLDITAPTTTITGAAFSADTGTAGDFITKTAAQTITATLSAALATGEKLYGSLDNGGTWNDVSGSVSGTTLTLTGQTLTASNTMKLKVTDAAGNDGAVASQAYVLDTTPPVAPEAGLFADSGSSATDSITNNGTVNVTLEANATWEYSTNSGSTWNAGTGTSFTLPAGTYAINAIQIRQIDVAGNVGPISGNDDQQVVIDATAPSIVIAAPTTVGAGTFNFTFSEAVTGFDASDVVVVNGTKGTFSVTDASHYSLVITPNSATTPFNPINLTVDVAASAANDVAGNASTAAQQVLESVLFGTSGADTLTVGANHDLVFLGAGNDVLKLSTASVDSTSAPDIVGDFAAGDKIDLSLLMSAANYTSSTLGDTGAGFIELNNVTLTKEQANNWTIVEFNIKIDSATINSSKISGMNIDLDYDVSKVIFSAITSPTYTSGPSQKAVWTPLDGNFLSTDQGALPTGKIALPANTSGTNPIITDSTNNVLNVKLYVTGLVNSFGVSLQSKASGGTTDVTTEDTQTHNVDVGVPKTAGALAGTTGVLEVFQDTGALGTVGDNQLHWTASYNSADQMTHLQAKVDLNPTIGTTTLSGIYALDFQGDVTANLVPSALTFI